mgnify:CR=1 FL=1
MCRWDRTFMEMNPTADCGTQAAASCSARCAASHSALILDTMVMVSIFVILCAGVEGSLAVLLVLVGTLLIMLARIIRADTFERRLLSI